MEEWIMKKFILIFTVLTALVINACDMGGSLETGTLRIEFAEGGGGGSRAAAPGDDKLAYELILTGPGNQKIETRVSAEDGYTGQVVQGKWQIVAVEYQPGNDLSGLGSTEVTVGEGTTRTQVPLIAAPSMILATPDETGLVIIEGSGEYAYTHNFPAQEGVFIAGRTVQLSPFKIAEHETTYELWYTVRQWALGHGYTFSNYAGQEGNDGANGAAPGAGKQEPVTHVSWRDAVVWCNAYSEMTGKDPVYYLEETTNFNDTTKVLRVAKYSTNTYSANTAADRAIMNPNAGGYRLPTEAEWEYAARGGKGPGTEGPFAYKWAGTNDSSTVKNYAWRSGNAGNKTHPVGGKLPNTLELYDMSGNVEEWCWDWIDDVSTGTVTNPAGPASPRPRLQPNRIVRGGSYMDGYDSGGAVAIRGDSHPYQHANSQRGFRVVCR
jgi:formylglycine-generating enzyme required for sulfatase activity